RWPEGSVSVVAFSPDGRHLAGAEGNEGSGGAVWVWDLDRPGDEPLTLRATAGSVRAVCFSPDGHRLAIGRGDSTQVWNLNGPAEPPITLGMVPGGYTNEIAFSPDGKRLVAGNARVIRRTGGPLVWDLDRPGSKPLLSGPFPLWEVSAAFSPRDDRNSLFMV